MVDGERADSDIDIKDIHIHIQLHSERVPGPAPFQLPDPLQPASSLTELLTAVAALLARRQPHSAPLLHSAWTVQQVITEECRNLGSVHYEFGTTTPAAWIQVLEKRLSLWCQQCQQSALAPRARSLWCIGKWRSGHCRRLRPKSDILFWSPGPVALGALRGSSRVCSGFVSRLPEHAWSNAAVGPFGSSGASSHLSRFCVRSSPHRQRRGCFFSK